MTGEEGEVRWYCPLLKETIDEGLCLDINYERVKACVPDVLPALMETRGYTRDDVTKICTRCEHCPLDDRRPVGTP